VITASPSYSQQPQEWPRTSSPLLGVTLASIDSDRRRRAINDGAQPGVQARTAHLAYMIGLIPSPYPTDPTTLHDRCHLPGASITLSHPSRASSPRVPILTAICRNSHDRSVDLRHPSGRGDAAPNTAVQGGGDVAPIKRSLPACNAATGSFERPPCELSVIGDDGSGRPSKRHCARRHRPPTIVMGVTYRWQ
jgi:hypothetical protein